MADDASGWHPVWGVYDRLRSARLSVKYFACQLHSVERTNFWLDLILFASAPTSAIAGLTLWHSVNGELIWQGMGIVAAFIAVIKPLLALPKRIKEYESILAGYRTLEYDLMELKTNIEQRGKYDAPLQAEFRKALQREKALIGKNPESKESAQLKAKCQAEVIRELPAASFFIPQETAT
jgi:hypothetical protein